MRPHLQTPAHKTGLLAELVCSNSLKSEQENTAPWLLKEELRRLESLLIDVIAPRARVPAGHALTVDREVFAAEVTRAMESDPLIEIRREEATALDDSRIWIVASGPLTSDALAAEIARLTGSTRLFFYDSISPIVDAETIDTAIAFAASRYGKSIDGTDDYLNCPFDKPQYEAFLDALLAASSVPAHIEGDGVDQIARYFESCLPIEELARRGRETLRFGPMKPMGLDDPRTGRRPYAVVQLRSEDLRAGSYNLVGFQNHMRFGDQQRVLRMIPGLEHAEFLRYGQVHRNTYINGPALLNEHSATARRTQYLFRGPDFRRRGLRGIDRHGSGRRPCRGRFGARRAAAFFPAPDCVWIAMRLCFRRRPGELPARQYHVRSAAEAGASAARPQAAPRASVPTRARVARGVSVCPSLNPPPS